MNNKLNVKLNALVLLAAISTAPAFADEAVKPADAEAQVKPNKQIAAIGIPAASTTDGAVKPPLPAAEADSVPSKVLIKPGQALELSSAQEDLQPTDDINVAREQKDKYADSPEAHFIYAVALTRTSRVEEALQEVRTARRLAMQQPGGGYNYFDKMIKSYEDVLSNAPDDNRIRYGLAWAYYMKAYLLAQDSKKAQKNYRPGDCIYCG